MNSFKVWKRVIDRPFILIIVIILSIFSFSTPTTTFT